VIIKLIKFILVNTSKLSLCLFLFFITILLQVIILLITYKAIWFILRRELKLITIIILILVITILVIVISLFKILMVCIIGLNLF
jgi:hypothetical protein